MGGVWSYHFCSIYLPPLGMLYYYYYLVRHCFLLPMMSAEDDSEANLSSECQQLQISQSMWAWV